MKKYFFRIVFICFISLLIQGCDIAKEMFSTNELVEKETKKLRDEMDTHVASLTQEISMLKKEADALKEKEQFNDFMIKYLASSVDRIELVIQTQPEISIYEKKYSVVTTDLGHVTAVVSNIKGYAAGSEVSIRLVNLASASLLNSEVEISYSDLSRAEIREMNKPYQFKKKVDNVSALRPAKEKLVRFAIPEYKPDQIKYMAISIRPSGIEYFTEK